jgi:hypothetical protein
MPEEGEPLVLNYITYHFFTTLYCAFIIFYGTPIFVDFMDSVKPRNKEFNVYFLLYICIY